MNDNKLIGEFITNKRKALGLTQKELASKLFVTNKAVSKWETGEGLPDIVSLSALSKIFNVSIENILEASHTDNQSETMLEDNKEKNKASITNKNLELLENTSNKPKIKKFNLLLVFDIVKLVFILLLTAWVFIVLYKSDFSSFNAVELIMLASFYNFKIYIFIYLILLVALLLLNTCLIFITKKIKIYKKLNFINFAIALAFFANLVYQQYLLLQYFTILYYANYILYFLAGALLTLIVCNSALQKNKFYLIKFI